MKIVNKILSLLRPSPIDIDFNEVLEATGGPHKPAKPIHFEFFSGVDIKVEFEFFDGTKRFIPEIQGVTWSANNEIGGDGSASFDILHIPFGHDAVWSLKDKVKNIKLKAANEYGGIMELSLNEVTFVSTNSGVSIDDIVIEARVCGTAMSFTSWTRIRG